MTSTSAPLRITVIAIRRPIASANMSRCRSWALVTGLPAAASSRSPVRSPARAAGPPGTTSTTRSPVAAPALSRSGAGSGAGMLTRPRYARRTRPCCMSAVMIRLVVALTGTARPTPAPATAVLMPTTRAWLSASPPPEFPGVSAASVWITSSISRAAEPLRVGSDRPRPLTTPAVTEPARPSGLPTATTSWPTTSSSASPSSAGGGVWPIVLSTARSESGSAPTTRNGAAEPPANGAVPAAAWPTTCALVSRNPSPVKTTAEPRLSPPPPSGRRGTRKLATLPVSSAATPATICEYASSGESAATSPSEHCDYIITVNIRHWGGASPDVKPSAESAANPHWPSLLAGGPERGTEPGALRQFLPDRHQHHLLGYRRHPGAHLPVNVVPLPEGRRGNQGHASRRGQPAEHEYRRDHDGHPGQQHRITEDRWRVRRHPEHPEHQDGHHPRQPDHHTPQQQPLPGRDHAPPWLHRVLAGQRLTDGRAKRGGDLPCL